MAVLGIERQFSVVERRLTLESLRLQGKAGAKAKRDRMKIISDILEITRHGSTKTRIMYKANLSYDQLMRYLKFLQETRLLISFPQDRKYHTSSKGILFLRTFEDFWKMGETVSKQFAILSELAPSTSRSKHFSTTQKLMLQWEKDPMLSPRVEQRQQ